MDIKKTEKTNELLQNYKSQYNLFQKQLRAKNKQIFDLTTIDEKKKMREKQWKDIQDQDIMEDKILSLDKKKTQKIQSNRQIYYKDIETKKQEKNKDIQDVLQNKKFIENDKLKKRKMHYQQFLIKYVSCSNSNNFKSQQSIDQIKQKFDDRNQHIQEVLQNKNKINKKISKSLNNEIKSLNVRLENSEINREQMIMNRIQYFNQLNNEFDSIGRKQKIDLEIFQKNLENKIQGQQEQEKFLTGSQLLSKHQISIKKKETIQKLQSSQIQFKSLKKEKEKYIQNEYLKSQTKRDLYFINSQTQKDKSLNQKKQHNQQKMQQQNSLFSKIRQIKEQTQDMIDMKHKMLLLKNKVDNKVKNLVSDQVFYQSILNYNEDHQETDEQIKNYQKKISQNHSIKNIQKLQV